MQKRGYTRTDGRRYTEDIASKLDMGAARVIIGTKAVSDSDFIKRAADKYGDKIVVGIDAKDGFAAVEGWEKVSSLKAVDFAKQMESIGIQTIIYTDIATDGTLQGPNIAAMEEMAQSLGIDVIASGGIGNAEHVRQLKPTGVEGVIIGKALYTGAVTMKDGKIY